MHKSFYSKFIFSYTVTLNLYYQLNVSWNCLQSPSQIHTLYLHLSTLSCFLCFSENVLSKVTKVSPGTVIEKTAWISQHNFVPLITPSVLKIFFLLRCTILHSSVLLSAPPPCPLPNLICGLIFLSDCYFIRFFVAPPFFSHTHTLTEEILPVPIVLINSDLPTPSYLPLLKFSSHAHLLSGKLHLCVSQEPQNCQSLPANL